MDAALLIGLILLNGVLAMSEIAVVSSRQARLVKLAEDGNTGARSALALNREPSIFLSTVQVGITMVGILSGAIGEATLAVPLAEWLGQFPSIADHAMGIAMTTVVGVLTYLSVVVGELVPKQLGLLAPERVAARIARPMNLLSRMAGPLVLLLSSSSSLLLFLLGVRRPHEPSISDDEIKLLMEQGAEAGVFHASERAIVANVLRLDQQWIGSIMTPRKDIYLLDLNDDEAEIRRRLAESVQTRRRLPRRPGQHRRRPAHRRSAPGGSVRRTACRGAFRPGCTVRTAGATVTQLLETFRRARQQCALAVDEYGELEGLVTLTDVLTSIVGDLPNPDIPEECAIVVREDGSWLADGDLSIERIKSFVGINGELPGERQNAFTTIGGFVMYMLGRVPVTADHFESDGIRFEVVDMDRNRVDKVLISRLATGQRMNAAEH